MINRDQIDGVNDRLDLAQPDARVLRMIANEDIYELDFVEKVDDAHVKRYLDGLPWFTLDLVSQTPCFGIAVTRAKAGEQVLVSVSREAKP